MEIHIKIIGVLFILLALIHLLFPKRFNWNTELRSLNLLNRQIMIIHTFFIGLTVFMMGILCLTCSYDLIHTTFGKKISLGLGIFWTIRLYIQFFGYSTELWKGKRFETCVHVVFSLMWTYVSFVFISTYFS
jgi:hypothetical protein